MNWASMADESTCDGQRKYFHRPSQVLAFLRDIIKNNKGCNSCGMQPYVFCSPNLKLAQLSDVLSETRLQVSSLVVVDNVDLSQLV